MMAPGTGVRERPPRFLVVLPSKVMVVDQAVPGSHRVLTAVTANVSEGGRGLGLQGALPPWFLGAPPARVRGVDQAVPGSHRALTAVTATVSEGGMALDLQEALPPW